MSLSALQQRFAQMVGQLIAWTYLQSGAEPFYTLTFGEAFRTAEQAALNAQNGTGIANSLHCERLAVDLNLFKDGVFMTKVSDYEPLGVYWENLGGSWGGRFSKPDADHFSLSPDGGKTR